MEGNGVCTWNDGKVYKGEWKNDLFEGQGILTQYSRYGKVEYQGQFKGGLREGHGVFRWPDKSSYAGNWKDDEPYGEGKFTDKKLTMIDGKKGVKKAIRMLQDPNNSMTTSKISSQIQFQLSSTNVLEKIQASKM